MRCWLKAAKDSAEASQTDLKEKHQAAKDAKAAADAEQKAAAKSLEDFMPDLKKVGDSLDEAKEALKDFDVPMQAYAELKDLKEDDFKEPEEEVEDEAAKRAKVGEAEAAPAPEQAA